MKKGYFNEKVSLEYGKNTIKLVAEDVAGNKSVYTATVDYEMSKSSRNKIYIYAVIIVVLVIVYMVVFIKGIRRRKKG
jgi:t-SNARE complex subunit (syntaxin)